MRRDRLEFSLVGCGAGTEDTHMLIILLLLIRVLLCGCSRSHLAILEGKCAFSFPHTHLCGSFLSDRSVLWGTRITAGALESAKCLQVPDSLHPVRRRECGHRAYSSSQWPPSLLPLPPDSPTLPLSSLQDLGAPAASCLQRNHRPLVQGGAAASPSWLREEHQIHRPLVPW